MQNIFIKKFKGLYSTISTRKTYLKWGYNKPPKMGDVLKRFGNNPVYLLRFSDSEIVSLINMPCPVENIKLPHRNKMIHSFKRLRDFYDINERKVCFRCPMKKTCSLENKIPNLEVSADISDVFNVLAVYAHIGLQINELEEKLDLAQINSQTWEKQYKELNDHAKVKEIKDLGKLLTFSGKYKPCLNILSSIKNMIIESFSNQKTLLEFVNAIEENNHSHNLNEEAQLAKYEETRELELAKAKEEAVVVSSHQRSYIKNKLPKDDQIDYSKPINVEKMFPQSKSRLTTDQKIQKAKIEMKRKIQNTLMKKFK